ncbi:hypothetical protein GAO09_19520 [Rhizobiales bacterium RZME27]|uniref:Uncharacterized protein n=1 Tax=Endobacterium cereale TaxID=2663029 RepID=A0A6A8AEL4_9HYPH|nr:hypothetical protein [Endobacterium cereale]MQY48227.1 hypothetical protein [Endobacterium cereale]
MTRTHTIQADETLIAVVCSQTIKRSYVRESSFFGKSMTPAEILDELADDEIVAVRRLNVETWVSEDITEECARLWLYAREEKMGVELNDAPDFPAFVTGSRAWKLWKDDLEAEARQPVTRPYSTLNNRTQGTGRAYGEAVR